MCVCARLLLLLLLSLSLLYTKSASPSSPILQNSIYGAGFRGDAPGDAPVNSASPGASPSAARCGFPLLLARLDVSKKKKARDTVVSRQQRRRAGPWVCYIPGR